MGGLSERSSGIRNPALSSPFQGDIEFASANRLGPLCASDIRYYRGTPLPAPFQGQGNPRAHCGPLAAERLGALAHEINGAEPLNEISGHADDDAGLAFVGNPDDRDDARTHLFLALVRKALEVLDVDARHRAGQQLD